MPKLVGKSLSQARTALSSAHCRLGTVKRPKVKKGAKAPTLVVGSSNPKAGAKRANSTKVALVLVKKKSPRRR